ncbi:lytic transglycosylase domain-containing protein [Roseobacter sp. HKCCA0434]|uniref:lytic transglycosylase domain-containing protein n=1 Tax=Roseobacter sp. HKCCA0434 TaxID=3079297 RepID=UPI002905D032|nr:lytic transglycosylase domain-containing protein [Roseobacter sp. HKCCA0434]
MRVFVFLMLWALPGLALTVPEAGSAARPPAALEDWRCTEAPVRCIRLSHYIPDTCASIEAEARDAGLEPGYFARLIWRESLFDPRAVSPAGAQGIAQFMPSTAALRGLEDPFDPAEALRASAVYLAEMSGRFGNEGLAAIAYNGGENRAARFIAGNGGLPTETRNYVAAITGHVAEIWRDAPPETVDYRLDPERSFLAACIEMAGSRRFASFEQRGLPMAWGVLLAAHRTYAASQSSFARVQSRYPGILGGEAPVYFRGRPPGTSLQRHLVQIGRPDRASAQALCDRLRGVGGTCLVMRN